MIILGEDSRKNRYEIGENYEQEIKNMDRASLGLITLGNYESYLGNDLPDSALSSEILERVKKLTIYISNSRIIVLVMIRYRKN